MMSETSTPRRPQAPAIRMIVTDLDRTLLRRDKTISAYTACVFRRCISAGIRIVPATARPVRAVKMLGLPFALDACVCHNGAVITIADKLFLQTGIGSSDATALLHAAKWLSGMRVAVEMNDTLYANFDAETVWPGAAAYTDLSGLPAGPADKILFITADADEIAIIKSLLGGGLYGEVSESKVLMVMNKDARKRNAVRAIAAHYGVAEQQIAAFGDDFNDIEMLRMCGTGIAVENAITEVKAAADYICPSNDEDGVAKWIEEYAL